MKELVTVIIMPESDKDLIAAKHWLVAKCIEFKTIYVPVDESKKASVMMARMSRWNRLLFKLSFGFKTERVTAFG